MTTNERVIISALGHILTRTDVYQKHPQNRFHLSRVVGPGVLVAEGVLISSIPHKIMDVTASL